VTRKKKEELRRKRNEHPTSNFGPFPSLCVVQDLPGSVKKGHTTQKPFEKGKGKYINAGRNPRITVEKAKE
jgi:hypothetical protein